MIRVHYRNSAYYLRLSNLINEDIILFKFDTGAVNTIISFETLVDSNKLKKIDKQRVRDSLRKGIQTKTFTSASGNNMIGYLCKAANVNVNGEILKQFYYYLTFDVRNKVALLGDDFISCCNFVHSANSDIIIEGFDNDEYGGKHNIDALSENEISSALLENMN